MAALLAPAISGEVGLRLLLAPLSSNVVIRTASCAVGIGLPVYSTYRAIEKKDQDEKERLLLYWAAYGSFSIVESFADKLVSRRITRPYRCNPFLIMIGHKKCTGTCNQRAIARKGSGLKKPRSVPLYYHAKFAILIWLQFPSNGGSKHVYRRYLRPFFRKHQAKIDRILNILSKELTKFVSNHEDEIRFVENMAIRGATTASYIVNGLDQPGQSEVSVTEDPNSTPTEEPDTPRVET